jgi:hypothetical protein
MDNAKPIPQVMLDGDAPRIAAFVWLEDGTCHQVSMNMGERKMVAREILRKHDFRLKVLSAEIPLQWRETKEADELPKG